MLLDLLTTTEVNTVNAIARLTLSMALGSAIGIERMMKGQTAGMRTFALIATGATLAMLVSIYIPQEYMGLKNGDPGRIAAQVVSGIGFLGAGAIIQMKGSVRGLTTAAGIWLTAMIGLAVGSGMYLVSCVAAIITIVVFTVMDRMEHITRLGGESKIVRFKANGIIEDIEPQRQVFREHRVHVSDAFIKYDYRDSVTIINFLVRAKASTRFVPLFEQLRHTADTLSITLSNEVNV